MAHKSRNSCSRYTFVMVTIFVLSLLDSTLVHGTAGEGGPPASAIVSAASRLPDHIRQAVMSGVGVNFEGEGKLQLAPGKGEHDDLLSVGQRRIWIENFNNARNAGMSIPEAQKAALRGAADGKVYVSPQPGYDDSDIPAGVSHIDRSKAETVTCMSCHHTVRGRAEVLSHYRGDWHHFNAHRRNQDLAPIPESAFIRRVEESSKNALAEEETKAMEGGAAMEDGAGVRQGLEEDDEGPRQSKAHPGHGKATVGANMMTKTVSNKGIPSNGCAPPTAREVRKALKARKRRSILPCEGQPVFPLHDSTVNIAATTCPFDGSSFGCVEDNLEHMASSHGFRLPAKTALVPGSGPGVSDVHGLVTFLVRKVFIGHACISCGDTFESVQVSSGHADMLQALSRDDTSVRACTSSVRRLYGICTVLHGICTGFYGCVRYLHGVCTCLPS